MSLWARLLLAVFAVYRLSSLIAREEGPFSVFDHLRMRLGAYDYDEYGTAETALGRGIGCVFCVGVYTAALLLFPIYLPTLIGDILLTWLGIAGGQVFLERLTNRIGIVTTADETAGKTEV